MNKIKYANESQKMNSDNDNSMTYFGNNQVESITDIKAKSFYDQNERLFE